ncbi:hypothetical protein P8605_00125 [Streptomyces sp. T-3]|nr:hypothetical protein [Streptomyces sp. T-3]
MNRTPQADEAAYTTAYRKGDTPTPRGIAYALIHHTPPASPSDTPRLYA